MGSRPALQITKKVHLTRSDNAYQLLAHGRWFFPGTPASSTTKTGRHDIADILLNVALSTKNIKSKSLSNILLGKRGLCMYALVRPLQGKTMS